jgi:hypothetical protein
MNVFIIHAIKKQNFNLREVIWQADKKRFELKHNPFVVDVIFIIHYAHTLYKQCA